MDVDSNSWNIRGYSRLFTLPKQYSFIVQFVNPVGWDGVMTLVEGEKHYFSPLRV